MKYLITGSKGQLGKELLTFLRNEDVIGIDRDELDITDEQAVMRFVIEHNFDVIIHCAAWTQVDLAEEEREKVYAVNVLGTKYIARAAKEIDAKLIYLSTDYIFDGEGDLPYEVNHQPQPINYYGKTKYEGEQEVLNVVKHFIVRISWVFALGGRNFIETMLSLAQTRDELTVVDDQVGSPTFTYDLAQLLIDMSKSNHYGIYHATNEGYCSWYEFAKYIFEVAEINISVKPVSSEQFKTAAKRPKNSRLSKKSLDEAGFNRLPTWQDAVERYIKWREI